MKTKAALRILYGSAFLLGTIVVFQGCQKEPQGVQNSTTNFLSGKLLAWEETTIDVPALLQAVRANLGRDITLRLGMINHANWDLQLTIVDDGSESELYENDVLQPPQELYTLVGHRVGCSDRCMVTLAKDWLNIVLVDSGEEYHIEGYVALGLKEERNRFVVYRARDVVHGAPVGCGNETDEPSDLHADATASGEDRSTCKKLKMTAVCDADFRNLYTTTAYASAMMGTQINNASFVYWNTSNLLIDMSKYKTYVYTNYTDVHFTTSYGPNLVQGQLATWGNTLSARRSMANLLFTGKNIWRYDENGNASFSLAGIAYGTGEICDPDCSSSSSCTSYAVVERMTFGLQWQNLIAHEVGHLLGASHVSPGLMADNDIPPNSIPFNASTKTQIQYFTAAHNCYTTGTCN